MSTTLRTRDEKFNLPNGSQITVSKTELMEQGVSLELYETFKEFLVNEIFFNGYTLLNYSIEDFATSIKIVYRNEFDRVLSVKIQNTKKFPTCDGLFSSLQEI
ncbi:MAG: hypothetical protein QNJ31_09605 [Candidatus Caenarcaniphilales bacterium]|nr:hypothetical protein [Candidatus Caenarcaniphilales bacterium]